MNAKLNHRLGFTGLAAAIVNTLLIIILDVITPGYNSIRQYVSEFGIIPGMTSVIVSVWWICFGLLLVLFAIGLNRSIVKSGRTYWLGPLLIALYGLLDSVGSGIFPMDPAGASETFSGIIHTLLSFLGITAIIFSPLAIVFRMKKDPDWKSLVPFAWLTQIFFGTIYLICLGAFSGMFLADYIGLLQRIFIFGADFWLAVLSYYTVKMNKNQAGSASEPAQAEKL